MGLQNRDLTLLLLLRQFCPAAATIAAGAAALPDAAATDGAWDVSLEKATSNSNVRLRFDQSISIHSENIYFLYELFKVYTLRPPKSTNRKPDKRTVR